MSVARKLARWNTARTSLLITPGRIEAHSETLKIDQVQTLVLDEADRMLDMGFTDVQFHVAHNQPSDITISATYPENIRPAECQDFSLQPFECQVKPCIRAAALSNTWSSAGAMKKNRHWRGY